MTRRKSLSFKPNMTCPVCADRMFPFVPLVYSGDDVHDFRCKNDNYPAMTHLTIKER